MIAVLFAIMVFVTKNSSINPSISIEFSVHKHRYVELMFKDKTFFVFLFVDYFVGIFQSVWVCAKMLHIFDGILLYFLNLLETFVDVFKSGFNNNIFMNWLKCMGKCWKMHSSVLVFVFIFTKFDNCLGWYILFIKCKCIICEHVYVYVYVVFKLLLFINNLILAKLSYGIHICIKQMFQSENKKILWSEENVCVKAFAECNEKLCYNRIVRNAKEAK